MGQKMPEDVKQTALWIVKGYDRRLAWYQVQKEKAKTQRAMERLEQSPEVTRMRAVEQAAVVIGADIGNDDVRNALRSAILLNCKSGRHYPYERLGELSASRADFYRRKEKFLTAVALNLKLSN